MAFCSNCGKALPDDAKFCLDCGQNIFEPQSPCVSNTDNDSPQNEQSSKVIYEGEVHKCPVCGNPLGIYDLTCSFCGHELRGQHLSTTIRLFTDSLREAQTDTERANLISEFPVPNNREDILEFIILASANISGRSNQQVFYAWVTKFEHCYEKSKILPLKEEEHNHIENIHRKTSWQITCGKAFYSIAVPLRSLLNILRKVPKIVYIIVFAILLYALIPAVQDAVSPILSLLFIVSIIAICVVLYIVLKGNILDSLIARIENALGISKTDNSAATQTQNATREHYDPQVQHYARPQYESANHAYYSQFYNQSNIPHPYTHGRWKNKWVSLILCILFGYLGVHRFYEGKFVTGIIYLFTMGLFGIGILIDIIIILGKTNPYCVK